MDADELRTLLESFRPLLLVLAHREVGDKLRVRVSESDLVQETFYAAVKNAEQFQGHTRDDAWQWLAGIFNNKLAHHVRTHIFTEKRALDREQPLVDFEDKHRTPSTVVETDDAQTKLAAALLRLSDDYRFVVQERALKNRSFAEIAKQLDKSEDAIRKSWFRGLEKLHALLNSSA